MRIVFLGTGDIGLPTLAALIASPAHEVAAVVTQPDKPAGRGNKLLPTPVKALALSHGLPVLQPERVRREAAIAEIGAFGPEALVVMAYGQILPQKLLDLPTVACLNLHASLLPRHRGASPVHAALLAGDSESGITVMHMAAGLDTGDMVLQKKFPLRPDETAGSLHDRLADAAPAAILEALALLAAGQAPRTPQDDSAATYAPKLDRDSGRLDWSQDAVALERIIRALHPWPGTWTTLADRQGQPKILKIHRASISHLSPPPGAVPGTIFPEASGLLVATGGGGALLLEEIQLEGKKRLPAVEFLRGFPLEPGARLGA